VDEGPIIKQAEVSIKGLTLDEMFEKLHKKSVMLWAGFLRRNWL
jgi:folate-dependent phosphoribosylglycinamide formyltransferase PurN